MWYCITSKKQKQTDGGTLTKTEQRIVQSPAYTELTLKLRISATGNEGRSDSDAGTCSPPAPTFFYLYVLYVWFFLFCFVLFQ